MADNDNIDAEGAETGPAPDSVVAGNLELSATFSPKVNLAQQQNSVPFLHELSITNHTDKGIDNLVVELSVDPGFCSPKTWHIDRIYADGSFRVQNVDLALIRPYLAELREAVRGSATLVAKVDGEEIARLETEVDILASDEWGGHSYLPELIAAFCRPNDRAVEQVLKKAADILRKAGKESGLDGYQSKNRKRVWNLVSAIYNAIASLGIDYTNPPASFEKNGQKVRSPGRVIESGLATCLDLALFLASALEQCGLNPLIILIKGHAFVGCWLVDEDFSLSAQDDPQALRKRVKLGEMVLIETTLLARQPTPSLKQATAEGLAHLDNEEAFAYAIDIKRARMTAIRPLMEEDGVVGPTAGSEAGGPIIPLEMEIEEAPDLPDIEFVATREEAVDTPEGRIERWKRKLLDLSLRNNLLNFRRTRKTIALDCPDPALLEDILADGKKLKFIPAPPVMEGDDPRSAAIHQERHGEEAKRQHALAALQRGDILVNLQKDDMEGRLVELYRKAKNDLEEGGANTLFLAIGFLTWTQSDNSERKLKAPLLLLPAVIQRKSVRSGFTLLLHDDDPTLNPTLLEMLKQDFDLTLPSLSDDLPRDHSGLDVPLIWQTVRKAIRDIKGWEVTEEVCLGTFSFTKYLMWKDLEDRTDQLKKNPVVQHLIDAPREVFPAQGEIPEAETLDEVRSPQQTFCPMLADSSQLSAVFAAAEGRNFVLVGPPGTGKSQTITNMIVQCLAEGKTVLFVSEKMAALDVVYRRLKEVGVASSCLEIHSSKARKAEVLKQLGDAWDAAGLRSPQEWDKEARRLARMRDDLNKFPRHLHKQYGNGLSPYSAFSHVIGNRQLPVVEISWPTVDTHDESAFERLREIAKRLGVNAGEVGGVAENPFRGVARGEWSPNWQAEFDRKVKALRGALDPLQAALANFVSATGLPSASLSREDIAIRIRLAELLPFAFGKSYGFAFAGEARSVCQALNNAITNGRKWLKFSETLSQGYRRDATSLNLERLVGEWQDASDYWWPKSAITRRAVTKELKLKSESGRRPDRAHARKDLITLASMKVKEDVIASLSDYGQELGSAWKGLDSDWAEIEVAKEWAEAVAVLLGRIAGSDVDALLSIRASLRRLVVEGNDLLAEGGPVGGTVKALRDSHDAFNSALTSLTVLVDGEKDEAFPFAQDIEWLQVIASKLDAWSDRLPKLRGWCAWRAARNEAVEADLKPLVDAIEESVVSPEGVSRVFEYNYRRWWTNAVVENDPVLCNFVSADHQRLIEEFQELDKRFMSLTKQYVRARLAGNVPAKGNVSGRQGTEWGILNRELQKRARHMPLRKLVGALPNALTKLTPCLLMSPLSIAQYLSAGTAPFDVVIFDEASQIPVWDAIGAIARGKQAVVVGDPKQLPPTSFFGRNDTDEDDDVDVEDLESILDECIGARLPTIYLRWHYRSRHENLITFSNHNYYNGRLVTFPSAVTDDQSVKFVHVADGIYERGRGRINRGEAQAVVDRALHWLKDQKFNAEKWTLGIVTFNQQQQTLILDLLDDARRKDPSLERHFSADLIEPVFVKNLENVQGDERDIILFSITYGPPRVGRISMNFGPLNKEGGERRLNVAITRAREAVEVYGTLRADEIDLSRTQSLGVRDFKHYLEFAERGPRALAEAIDPTGRDYDSPFEEEVARSLTERGWAVHPQVGVSGFRIDIGIVHPDFPGRYLAGVECDGATYHRAASARDRDRLRELVLRRLGWEILRIWSTDWWIDADGSTDKIQINLERLLEQDRARQGTQQEFNLAEEESPTEIVIGSTDFDEQDDEIWVQNRDAGCLSYQVADPLTAVQSLNPDGFHEASEYRNLSKMIEHIVESEGPVVLNVLADRVARAYGFKRTGARILKRVKGLASRKFKKTQEGSKFFYWPSGADFDSYESFRIADGSDEMVRKVEDIAVQELRNLATYVRETDCPVNEKELARCMTERLGFKRMTAQIEKRLLLAISAGRRN